MRTPWQTSVLQNCIVKATGRKFTLVQLGLLNCISCSSLNWHAWEPHKRLTAESEEASSSDTHENKHTFYCNVTKPDYLDTVLCIRGICFLEVLLLQLTKESCSQQLDLFLQLKLHLCHVTSSYCRGLCRLHMYRSQWYRYTSTFHNLY